MIQILSVLTLLASAAAPAGTTLEVGKADWDAMPALIKVERRLPYEDMAGFVEQILADKQCKLKGQSARRFDITVPYAVLLEPDGKARRVVVADMGCMPLETLVGNMVADMAETGDFRPSPAKEARWYSSQLNINLE